MGGEGGQTRTGTMFTQAFCVEQVHGDMGWGIAFVWRDILHPPPLSVCACGFMVNHVGFHLVTQDCVG